VPLPLPSRSRRLALGIALLCTVHVASAQGAAPVPPTDLAYQDIDRLAELGVLDSLIIGQRPYSRREFVRIIERAHVRLDRVDRQGSSRISDAAAGQANGILQRLEARFGNEFASREPEGPVFAPIDGLALSFSSTDAIRRGFVGNGALLEATLDPLAANRLGDPPVRGQTTSLEISQRFEPTPWLAFHARERLEYRAPRQPSTATKTEGELLLAGMRARLGNVALSVGREQLAWSQGEDQGLFLSSTAPALDQISLAGDAPFALPGILRVLGPTQATLVFADLGYSQMRSHSKLLAYKVSVQPASALEIGGTFMNHFGGAGARKSGFGDRLIDFLPFVDIFRPHNYTDTTRALDVESDKLLGVDARLRLDRLGGVLLTGEVLIDDFDVHRIPQLLTGYGASTVGIVIPQLGTPEWSLRLSAKHTGILTYTHAQLTNGITTHGRLLGDDLGPDAKAFGGELRWIPGAALRVALEGRAALFSNAQYESFYADSAQTRFVVRKTSSGPNELRDRVVGTIEIQTEAGLALVVRGGGERIRNANFQDARRRSYVAEVALRLRQ
jgi:hypothetical protein